MSADSDSFASVLSLGMSVSRTGPRRLQNALADRGVRISASTLSYWANGKRLPEGPRSLDAVTEIESILAMPVAALTSRIGPSRRVGPVRRPVPLPEVAVQGPAVQHLLSQLGLLETFTVLQEQSVRVTVDVDESGRQVGHTVVGVYRAMADVSRMPMLVMTNGEAYDAEPVVHDLRGCRLGRTLMDQAHGVCAYELCFDRPLRAGETTLLAHSVAWPPSPLDVYYEQYLPRATPDVTLWVRFTPGGLPKHCEGYVRDVEGYETPTALPITGTDNVHVMARGAGPGAVGIRWSW